MPRTFSFYIEKPNISSGIMFITETPEICLPHTSPSTQACVRGDRRFVEEIDGALAMPFSEL